MKQGIECAGAGGKVLLFTPAKPGERLTIEPNDLYFKAYKYCYKLLLGPTDTADALEIIESGIASAEKLVTHRSPDRKNCRGIQIDGRGKGFT